MRRPPKNLASVAVDYTHLGPPPRRAQVVGTVSFSESEKYMTRAAWNRDRKRHCIKRGSLLDWPCGKGQKYAWRIGQVRRFHEPVPVSDHTQTGYPTPRKLTVSFAGIEAWEVRSRLGASGVVGNGGRGTRGEIAGLLARLRAGVASSKAPPVASGSGSSRMFAFAWSQHPVPLLAVDIGGA